MNDNIGWIKSNDSIIADIYNNKNVNVYCDSNNFVTKSTILNHDQMTIIDLKYTNTSISTIDQLLLCYQFINEDFTLFPYISIQLLNQPTISNISPQTIIFNR